MTTTVSPSETSADIIVDAAAVVASPRYARDTNLVRPAMCRAAPLARRAGRRRLPPTSAHEAAAAVSEGCLRLTGCAAAERVPNAGRAHHIRVCVCVCVLGGYFLPQNCR